MIEDKDITETILNFDFRNKEVHVYSSNTFDVRRWATAISKLKKDRPEEAIYNLKYDPDNMISFMVNFSAVGNSTKILRGLPKNKGKKKDV